jgi:hypothetical protein
MFYLNGDMYEGSFDRGVKSGRGKYTWAADGDIYTYEGSDAATSKIKDTTSTGN